MRRGVLGGTFDPPHLGHLVLAEWARGRLSLDQVLWVPAGDPWRKTGAAVTAAAERVAMVRLAIEDNPACVLCLVEVERAGPTYSVDTLAGLQAQHPNDELFFLLGQDALVDLPNWREPDRLIELATLAVAGRALLGEACEPLTAAELDRLLPGLGRRVVWLDMPRIDLSATSLRRRAAEGRGLRYLVPDSVEAYILERRLYQR